LLHAAYGKRFPPHAEHYVKRAAELFSEVPDTELEYGIEHEVCIYDYDKVPALIKLQMMLALSGLNDLTEAGNERLNKAIVLLDKDKLSRRSRLFLKALMKNDDESDDESDDEENDDSGDASNDDSYSDFDSKHPRWPAGSPNSTGGEFRSKDDASATPALPQGVQVAENDAVQSDVPSSWGGDLKNLTTHFDEHGVDFGTTSAEDYASQASEFLDYARQNNLPMVEYPNGGEIGAWDPATNTFGVYNADGTTASFYKPTSPTYFQRQIDYVMSNTADGGRVINPMPSVVIPNNDIPEAPATGSANAPTGSVAGDPLIHNGLERPGHPELEE